MPTCRCSCGTDPAARDSGSDAAVARRTGGRRDCRHRLRAALGRRDRAARPCIIGKRGRRLPLRPARGEGQLVFDAAVAGVGPACPPEEQVQALPGDGWLVRVPANRCPPRPGHHLYDPSRRQPAPVFAFSRTRPATRGRDRAPVQVVSRSSAGPRPADACGGLARRPVLVRGNAVRGGTAAASAGARRGRGGRARPRR